MTSRLVGHSATIGHSPAHPLSYVGHSNLAALFSACQTLTLAVSALALRPPFPLRLAPQAPPAENLSLHRQAQTQPSPPTSFALSQVDFGQDLPRLNVFACYSRIAEVHERNVVGQKYLHPCSCDPLHWPWWILTSL